MSDEIKCEVRNGSILSVAIFSVPDIVKLKSGELGRREHNNTHERYKKCVYCYYNSNQRINKILLKLQKYYKIPAPTCFGLLTHHQGEHSCIKQLFHAIFFAP